MKNLHYYKLVAESLKNEFSLPHKIDFKNTKRGWTTQKHITIPLWTLKYGKEYTICYICHEIAHGIIRKYGFVEGHNQEFKKLEDVLISRFRLIIKRKKVYIKEIYSNRGERLFNIGENNVSIRF